MGEHNTRKKLKHYKIYFETVVMAAMTLMSIIVSIVGLRIDQRSQEISRKELEILTSERPPYFQFQIEDKPILTSDTLCMSEIEKMKRYIERTKVQDEHGAYSMRVRDISTLLVNCSQVEAITLAFDYGFAKGCWAAKAEGRATV